MSAKDSSTALATATEEPSWPDVIPEVVRRRHLHCVEQTPASATELRDSVGFFSDGRNMPHEVENTLFEAFVEDDYDGKLHLTTIHDERNIPIGVVFWREVPESEMQEWINYDRLAQMAKAWRINSEMHGGSKQLQISNDETRAGAELLRIQSETQQGQIHAGSKNIEELSRVRRDSLTWLEKIEQSHPPPAVITPINSHVPPDYAHAWVKIELLAVRPPWWGQRIGSLLLACSMCQAWLRNNSRCVLHVAGGTDNVPAVRLYERFGFVPAPGIFHKPDKDIFVLGNIGLALQSVAWSETLEKR